jgi:hypothetical protein
LIVDLAVKTIRNSSERDGLIATSESIIFSHVARKARWVRVRLQSDRGGSGVLDNLPNVPAAAARFYGLKPVMPHKFSLPRLLGWRY